MQIEAQPWKLWQNLNREKGGKEQWLMKSPEEEFIKIEATECESMVRWDPTLSQLHLFYTTMIALKLMMPVAAKKKNQ